MRFSQQRIRFFFRTCYGLSFFKKKIHVGNIFVLIICIDNVPKLFEMKTSEENYFLYNC